jgi:broad specificity phosphatase PhoE
MSELFLVRHAQASFGADNYDQLSPLGFQQSRWLGEYFRDRDIRFDRVITGSLARQRQTAVGIMEVCDKKIQIEELPGLNEFDFHLLGAEYCRLTDTPLPRRSDGHRPFFQLLRLAMQAWADDTLFASEHDGSCVLTESWQQFHDRIAGTISEIRQPDNAERILIISSGGAIAMALSQVLQCSVEALINMNMQIKNTGVSHLYSTQNKLVLSSFNNAPHLERIDRSDALTYA